MFYWYAGAGTWILPNRSIFHRLLPLNRLKKPLYKKDNFIRRWEWTCLSFQKPLFTKMPPFSIGWPGAKYDNWMIWYAKRALLILHSL